MWRKDFANASATKGKLTTSKHVEQGPRFGSKPPLHAHEDSNSSSHSTNWWWTLLPSFYQSYHTPTSGPMLPQFEAQGVESSPRQPLSISNLQGAPGVAPATHPGLGPDPAGVENSEIPSETR